MLLHDMSTDSIKFSDEDLAWFIANSASVWYAAAEAAETYAGVLAAAAGSKAVGDLSVVNAGVNAVYYRSMAARFRARGSRDAVPFAGGISQSGKDAEKADSDRVAPAAAIGIHDYVGTQ